MDGHVRCAGCRDGAGFDLPITMAFQPIVNIGTRHVFAYEALLRGVDGAGAQEVIATVTDATRYAFDQRCRVTAIELANALDLARDDAMVSINFLPNAVYEPMACIRLTLETAKRTGFPVERILFEFTESEYLDTAHLLHILTAYRDLGFKTAIDDFGAGYAGLELLARFQPDFVKMDMALIRGIDSNPAKQKIVAHCRDMLDALGVRMICEGIETAPECAMLEAIGVELMQGYLFARPEVAALPIVHWPAVGNGAPRAQSSEG